MKVSVEYIYRPKYEVSGKNQHGVRFKVVGEELIGVLKMASDIGDADDLAHLIMVGHNLGVPVHYDFGPTPQQAYIKVVSAEAI